LRSEFVMSAHQSTTWFWSDWAGDQEVRNLSPAERGLWIDLLTLAAVAAPTGYVCDRRGTPLTYEQIGRFSNCSAAEAENLIVGILEKGVASRDRDGRLFNRRMVRDAELSVKRRRAGRAGGAVTAMKWHGFIGVPGQLPGHVPRQTGARHSKRKITSTSDAAAREGTQVAEHAAPSGNVTSELAAAMQRKGWVR
jgi:hypothetical protein